MALIALKFDENVPAGFGITVWDGECPSSRHPTLAMELFHADSDRGFGGVR